MEWIEARNFVVKTEWRRE